METLREIIASLIFATGIVLITSFFLSYTEGTFVIFGIFCFVIAYFVWPSKKRGKRDNDNPLLDLLEIVIEFPVELIIWLFRLFLRLLRGIFGGKDGFDIDL